MKKLFLTILCAFLFTGCAANKPVKEEVEVKEETEEVEETIVEEDREPSKKFKSLVKTIGYEDINLKYPGLYSGTVGHMVEEGEIEILSFGYKNDVVTTMTNALYFDISTMDEENIQNLENYLVENIVTPFKKLDFCEVSYGAENDWTYKLRLDYQNMDNADHLKQVVDMGGLMLSEDSGKNPQFLSFSKTVESLKAAGWIER